MALLSNQRGVAANSQRPRWQLR